MNMTLREYLSEYQANRHGKNNMDFSHHSQDQHHGHFIQKLTNLEKIIKKYVKDMTGLSIIQRELEDLKNWLSKSRKNSRLRTSQNDTMISNVSRKNLMKSKKQAFTPIPVMQIHDDTFDELRVTNMTNMTNINNIDKQKNLDNLKDIKGMSRFHSQFCGDSRIQMMRVESREQIFDDQSAIKDQGMSLSKNESKTTIGLRSPKNKAKTNTKVFKAYSKQYIIETPSNIPSNSYVAPPTPTLPPNSPTANRIKSTICISPPSLKPMSQLTPSSSSVMASPVSASSSYKNNTPKALFASPPQLLHLNTLIDHNARSKEEQDSFIESVYNLPTNLQLVISR